MNIDDRTEPIARGIRAHRVYGHDPAALAAANTRASGHSASRRAFRWLSLVGYAWVAVQVVPVVFVRCGVLDGVLTVGAFVAACGVSVWGYGVRE